MTYVSRDKALAIIRKAVARSGSQKNFAGDAGVSESYLSDVLSGRREPATAVLAAVGLEKITIYTPASILREAAKSKAKQ